ncbi:MAG: Txe/YoeB family addiction module toxin [Spirulinaceae cyanobacterium]
MSPKKKKGDTQPSQPSHYAPVFSPEFKEDLGWWYRQDPKKANKILDLVADVLDGDPFTGLGKPELLKYIASDTWSRRIDLEHRLVYKVTNQQVYFLQARYHYQAD